MTAYFVKWNKVNGRYTEYLMFTSREMAIRALNVKILDHGCADARLIGPEFVTAEEYRRYFSE